MKKEKITITICPPDRGFNANFQCGLSGEKLERRYAFRVICPFLSNDLYVLEIAEEDSCLLFDKGFSATKRKVDVPGKPFEIEDHALEIMRHIDGNDLSEKDAEKLTGFFFYDTHPQSDVIVISGEDAKELKKLNIEADALFDKENRIPLREINPEISLFIGAVLKGILEQSGYRVSIEQAIRPDLYRAGMNMELQKFPNREKQIQLLLWENLEPEEALQEVKVTGLDLSGPQDKAISAIQILLDKRGYTSDLPASPIQSEAYHWTGSLPKIVTNYSEYFEAYGLEQKDGRYPRGRQREEAIEALKSLTETRRILYQRKYWSGKGKKREERYQIIRAYKPIISILEGMDVNKKESSRVMAGEDLTRRVTKIVVEVSPLLMDQIDSFYTLKPKALRKEIAAITDKKNVSETIPRFITWLLTKNQITVSISRDRLAERLGVHYLVETWQKKRLNTKLEEAFDMAKKLRFINSYRESKPGIFNFKLNPERCPRIKVKQEIIKEISSGSVV